MENWKPFPHVNFSADYEVSDQGRIRRSSNTAHATAGRVLAPYAVRNRHLAIRLRHTEGKFSFQIHRLVLLAFVGVDPARPCVNHRNGDPKDNRLSNLEWCTTRENEDHALANGLKPHGSTHWKAKLNEGQVAEIQRRYNSGDATQTALAREFGVSQTTVWHIVNGKQWAHVTVPVSRPKWRRPTSA